MKNILNVGCGSDYKTSCVNLDFNKKFKADVYFDLNKIYSGKKLPFKDNTFDLIILYDVLEHFSSPLPILKELLRVCSSGGWLEIKVPLGSWVWDNLDHKHQFSINSFNVKNFDDYSGVGEQKVELVFKEVYTLPSKNSFNHLLRIIFNKTNLYLRYRKL